MSSGSSAPGQRLATGPSAQPPGAPVVLVIEDEEWVARLLESGIREAGYDVVIATSARSGLDLACAVEPDCIVCDVTLPDHDGFWVASELRAQPAQVAVTPFLFLSTVDDPKARLLSFQVGGDVFMTKPFRLAEVVAQLGALVQMARRLREARAPITSVPPPGAAALTGELGQASVPTLLAVLEMEKRTGMLEVVSGKSCAALTISGGFVVDALVDGRHVPPARSLRAMLAVQRGRFSFRPLSPGSVRATEVSIGALLASVRDRDLPIVTEAPPPPEPEPAKRGDTEGSDAVVEVEADLTSYRPPP